MGLAPKQLRQKHTLFLCKTIQSNRSNETIYIFCLFFMKELYNADCNIYNPLRCQMGDLGSRHGLLTVGVGRNVFTDVNLPLYGNASGPSEHSAYLPSNIYKLTCIWWIGHCPTVLGRSIVIHTKGGSTYRLGCANLKLENHLVQKITIRKPQSFGR